MSLTVQKGFWQDTVIASTRVKLAELYRNNPDIVESEKRCMLEFWSHYEQLQSVLDGKWDEFKDWFTKATSPETITRCLRSLKEDRTIYVTHEDECQRREKERERRQYWGNEKRLFGGDGNG